MAWLSPILWPFLRVLAVFTVAPVFSMRAVPMRVKIGLAFLVALCAQAVLGDQPTVSVPVVQRVIATWREGGGPVVAPRYRGIRGNPVLFD